jgi:transcriptional regulator with XRE-family HTH domain
MSQGGVESIAARLKRLRLAQGLSQRDLSSPGVSYAYISRIEAGARMPSVKALRKLAAKLDVTVEYLETGVNETLGDRIVRKVTPKVEAIRVTIAASRVHLRYRREGNERTITAATLTEALLQLDDEYDVFEDLLASEQLVRDRLAELRARKAS